MAVETRVWIIVAAGAGVALLLALVLAIMYRTIHGLKRRLTTLAQQDEEVKERLLIQRQQAHKNLQDKQAARDSQELRKRAAFYPVSGMAAPIGAPRVEPQSPETDRLWEELVQLELAEKQSASSVHAAGFNQGIRSAYAAKLAARQLGAVIDEPPDEPHVGYLAKKRLDQLRQMQMSSFNASNAMESTRPGYYESTARNHEHVPGNIDAPAAVQATAEIPAPPIPGSVDSPTSNATAKALDAMNRLMEESDSARRASAARRQEVLARVNKLLNKEETPELLQQTNFVMQSAANQWRSNARASAEMQKMNTVSSEEDEYERAKREEQLEFEREAAQVWQTAEDKANQKEEEEKARREEEDRIERERVAADQARRQAEEEQRRKVEEERRAKLEAEAEAKKRAEAEAARRMLQNMSPADRRQMEMEQARKAELEIEQKMEEKRLRMRAESEQRLKEAQQEREQRRRDEENRRIAEQQEAERRAREAAAAAEAKAKRDAEEEQRKHEQMLANMNPTQRLMYMEHKMQLEKEKEFRAHQSQFGA